MKQGRASLAVASVIAVTLLVAAPAQAAKVVNGGFERDLDGWQVDTFGPGDWLLYGVIMRRGFDLPPPPQGQFAAVSVQSNPSTQVLSQVVRLERGMRHRLRFQLAYDNQNVGPPIRGPKGEGGGFFTPTTLGIDRRNQQFRMDVMDPDAPIKSVKRSHVLVRVYRTERGDPNSRPYRRVTANLSDFAGQKVRLRFAVAVTEEELNAGVDAVKIKSREIR